MRWTACSTATGFIGKFDADVGSRAEKILEVMRARYPAVLELVYDNYNALAFGFGPTERPSQTIFSIALFPRWVSLFFLQARGFPDPEKRLKGTGKVVLDSPASLDDPVICSLMEKAVEGAAEHQIIIKSVSAKQRPRRPAEVPGKGRRAKRRKKKANRWTREL